MAHSQFQGVQRRCDGTFAHYAIFDNTSSGHGLDGVLSLLCTTLFFHYFTDRGNHNVDLHIHSPFMALCHNVPVLLSMSTMLSKTVIPEMCS